MVIYSPDVKENKKNMRLEKHRKDALSLVILCSRLVSISVSITEVG